MLSYAKPDFKKSFSSSELAQELYQPNFSLYTFPDRTTVTKLLDLVVSVSDCSLVPLGLHGTVIGIKRANHAMDDAFQVLFETQFDVGFQLTISSNEFINCIYIIRAWEFINLSHGDRQGMQLWSKVNHLFYFFKFFLIASYILFSCLNSQQIHQHSSLNVPY